MTILFQVLEDLFKFKTSVHKDLQSEVGTSRKMLIHCSTLCRLWLGRSKARKDIGKNAHQPSLETGVLITDYLLKKREADKNFMLAFHLVIIHGESLQFHAKPYSGENDFSDFWEYLRPYFSKFLLHYDWINKENVST